jgi:hypothetical protein
MNPCPVCSAQIEDSFGLIECPQCHAILVADFDGNLKVQAPDGEEQPVSEVAVVEGVLDPAIEPSPEPTIVATPWDRPGVEMSPEPEEPPMEPFQDETLQEIQAYAGSEKSDLKEGFLFYDVTVMNLDTQELKDEVMEVLKDKKFNIDLKKINFKLPTLTIQDLNAVKASVLVTRLKHLPVDIEWVQKSVIEDKVEEGKQP